MSQAKDFKEKFKGYGFDVSWPDEAVIKVLPEGTSVKRITSHVHFYLLTFGDGSKCFLFARESEDGWYIKVPEDEDIRLILKEIEYLMSNLKHDTKVLKSML